MGADLLQPLEILTQLVVQDVRHHLGGGSGGDSRMVEKAGEWSGEGAHLVGLAVLDVPLPVEEPVGDLVLARVLGAKGQEWFMSTSGGRVKVSSGSVRGNFPPPRPREPGWIAAPRWSTIT